jgi:uncharacterized protein (DUF58 family)
MITRWLYKNYRATSSVKFWFHRKFTAAGNIVLVAMIVAAGIGVDTTQAMAYQAFTLLWILILFSVLWTIFRAPRFTARRVLPRVGTAGQPLHYRVTVHNPGSHSQSAVTITEDLGDPRPTLQEFSNNPEPGERKRNPFDRFFRFYRWMWLIAGKAIAKASPEKLPPLQPRRSGEISMQLMPLRRGHLHLKGFLFTIPDPFGLCRSHSRFVAPESVLILPKRYPIPNIQLGGALQYHPGGVSLSSSLGESEEFMSVREYRRGDPMRHIHWKSTSKTGKLIVKEFQNEYFVRHALILDTFLTDSQSPVFEEAVSVAASFACTLNTQESLLDLLFVGTDAYAVTAGHGVAQVDHMLEILAGVQPCTKHVFEELEQLVLRQILLVSGCVCIFLQWDEKRKELVEHMSSMAVPLLVFVIKKPGEADPQEDIPTQRQVKFHVLEAGKIAEGLACL